MQPASETFVLGQRLELKLNGEWFASRVEDQSSERQLTVAWPTDRLRSLVKVELGQAVDVMIAARQDAMYAAAMTVAATQRSGVPMLTLTPAGEWRRIQRRAAVRENVAVKPRIAQVVYGSASKPVRLGVTNVSASGVQVRSRDELRSGDLLELAFELDGEVHVKARVRRAYQNDRVWDAGCEFEDINESLAQRIVQFIFAQQRAMLRLRRGMA